MGAFAGRLPETIQDIGLYLGIFLFCVSVLGMIWHIPNRQIALLSLLLFGMFSATVGIWWSKQPHGDGAWLLTTEAIERFVSPVYLKAWQDAPGNPDNAQHLADDLHEKLLKGELVARGNPVMGDATQSVPVVIGRGRWQKLKIYGGDLPLASAINPKDAYDNLEIKKAAPEKQP